MSRKTMIAFMVIIAVVVAGAFVVAAQDDDGDDAPPFSPGWMHNWDGEGNFGPGMMQGGRGMMPGGRGGMMPGGFGGMMQGGHGMMPGGMMWNDGEPMMFAMAEAFGLEPEAFFEALREGQTLPELAEAQGVELDAVYEVMFAQAETHMAALVEAGTVTQEEADEHLTWMRENVAEMPMFSGSRFGFGMMGGCHWNNG